MAGGSAAADAGCTPFSAIVATGNIPGGYTIGTGMNAGFEWWSSVMGAQTSTGRVNLFVSELWHQPANMAVTFPFTGMIPAGTTYGNCGVCLQAALGCDTMGNNCQAEYLATSGSFNFTEGVRSPDAGTFAGSATAITYRHWDYMNDQAASSACFTVPSLSFRAVWPIVIPDAGSPDGGP